MELDIDTDFSLEDVPADEKLAFYGSLFGMSAIDDDVDRDELFTIYEILDTENLSAEATEEVKTYPIDPPAFEDCVDTLSDSDEVLRFATMINLVEVAQADEMVVPEEEEALDYTAETLHVSDEQFEKIEEFVETMREVRERGLNDEHAEQMIKSAVSGLTGVGVPVAAVYFSGSIIGLSAAGITSGLAALGLGFGMVPGIGVVVAIGTGAFLGVKYVLDTARRNKKEAVKAERERRIQRLIQNLQEMVEHLTERISELQESAEKAAANKEAVEKLKQRIQQMKKILAEREGVEVEVGA